jgi:pilus assembly protein CpaF
MHPPIVALVNAKGGSGATTIAAEVARFVGRSGKVAIVDGDLAGRRALAVVLDCARQFDEARLPGQPAVVKIGGITAVELVDELDASYSVRQESIEALIGALSTNPVIIADIPQPFARAVRNFVARTSALYVVLEPNLLGTSAARATIGDLVRFGVPLARLALVTNLRNGRSEISASELQKVLGVTVAAEIPTRGDRGYGRAIEAFARRIAATPAQAGIELRRASTSPLQDPRRERRHSDRTPHSGDPGGNGAAADGVVLFQSATPPADPPDPTEGDGPEEQRDLLDRIKSDIHEALAKRIDLVLTSRAHSDVQKLAELRAQISEIADSLLAEHGDVASPEELAELRQDVIDETLGLGPLEGLMRDESVTEIMVNGHARVYVERHGKLELTSKRFVNDGQLRVIIERIIAPLGRRIDEAQPMVDARLSDGSRVNAIIEPLSLNGVTLTMRRFGTKRLTIDDLVALEAVTPKVVDLLQATVQGRLNIIVSGGTGSGKTTFLNILSGFLPNDERIITIEDAAELLLKQDHVVRLESRPANLEGRGEIRIRDLVRNSLRMRPDRIIVGECRGGEALDMLQAMNTGHDGSLTTIHANSPRDALSRLETLVLMAGFDLPVRAIREQIASAINMIVQTQRMRDGSRKVVSISEVIGMEGDIITMQEIVRYKQTGLDKLGRVVGQFEYMGVQPHCLDRFEEMGIPYDVRDLMKLPSGAGLWA